MSYGLQHGIRWLPTANSKISLVLPREFQGSFIGLQDHGYLVWFRNIKIHEL